jgi:hypothetical protein
MKVRIRFAKSSKVRRRPGAHRRVALITGSLLTPAALAAWLIGAWRIAAGLHWAGQFAIPSGVFSYWQVWMAMAVLLQVCSRILNRYGKGDDRAAS